MLIPRGDAKKKPEVHASWAKLKDISELLGPQK